LGLIHWPGSAAEPGKETVNSLRDRFNLFDLGLADDFLFVAIIDRREYLDPYD
jgi:hypothetical protein